MKDHERLLKGGHYDIVTRVLKPIVYVAVFASSLSAACGASSVAPAPGMTLPSPEGCFVQVWDQPNFVGASDYINGPRRYPTLRDMPGRRNWGDRIQSLKVGPSSVVTVWSQENFRGNTLRAANHVAHRVLPGEWAGQIEAMAVECEGNAIR